MKVFWSWQDDSSGSANRHFIKAALAEAVEAIEGGYEAEDADRPELDHDTKGVAGAKEIVPTLMAKIAASVVFVADVTPIGVTAKGKALPNPNVMVELGWSLNKPGDGQQIYVLNDAEGWKTEQLPFDIRHRRVLTYTLNEGAEGKTRERVKKGLVKDLTVAIKLILDEHLNEKAQATPAMGVEPKADEPSIWAGGEAGFKHQDSMRRESWQHVAIPNQARAYLRVIPTRWKAKPPTAVEVGKLDPNSKAPDAFAAGTISGNYGVTKDGFVRYWIASSQGGAVEAENVSMYFDTTGEFWILHGSAVTGSDNSRFLSLNQVFNGWTTALRRVHWLLDHFGALPARRVELGFTGMEDVKFSGGGGFVSPPARRDSFKLDRTRRDWSSPTVQEEFLGEAFDQVFTFFGLDSRPPEEKLNFLRWADLERQHKNPYG